MKLEIVEPPLCCPTGLCGPAPRRFMGTATVIDLLTPDAAW